MHLVLGEEEVFFCRLRRDRVSLTHLSKTFPERHLPHTLQPTFPNIPRFHSKYIMFILVCLRDLSCF